MKEKKKEIWLDGPEKGSQEAKEAQELDERMKDVESRPEKRKILTTAMLYPSNPKKKKKTAFPGMITTRDLPKVLPIQQDKNEREEEDEQE